MARERNDIDRPLQRQGVHRGRVAEVLFFDGSGLCLFDKRLNRGTFRIPEPNVEGEITVEIGERELDDLLDGIGIDAPVRKERRAKIH